MSELVHRAPEGDSGVMPCCGLPPGERMADRMTTDPALVTCGRQPEPAIPMRLIPPGQLLVATVPMQMADMDVQAVADGLDDARRALGLPVGSCVVLTGGIELATLTDEQLADIGLMRRADTQQHDLPPAPAPEATDWVWSNHSMNGERQTWRELYDRANQDRLRAEAFATILSDLDRCEHGRHEGDVCSSCQGPSKGNPVMRLADEFLGQPGMPPGSEGVPSEPPLRTLGFDLSGNPIVVPERGAAHAPDAWRTR